MIRLKIIGLLLISINSFAQVGINTASPNSSAVLDIESSSKGVLIPRVNLTGKSDVTTIPSPANGLLVYNLNNGNNGTPATITDDTIANNFYYFSTETSTWNLIVNQTNLDDQLDKLGVPKLLVIATFPQTTSNYLDYISSSDISTAAGANIRQLYFKNKVFDRDGSSYDAANSIFTAMRTGYYQFEVSTLLVSSQAQPTNNVVRLGLSKTFTSGNAPTVINNGSFAILNQPLNSAISASEPLTIRSSGVIAMNAGDKVIVLTRYITPGTTGDSYSSDTFSAFGINRNQANILTVTYFPAN